MTGTRKRLWAAAFALVVANACDPPTRRQAPFPPEPARDELPAERETAEDSPPSATPEPCEPGAEVEIPPFVEDAPTRFLHRALLRAMVDARDPGRATPIHIGDATLFVTCSSLDAPDCRVRTHGWRPGEGPPSFDAPRIVAAAARLGRRQDAQALIDADMRRASEEARETGAALVSWLGVLTARELEDGWYHRLHVLPSVRDALNEPNALPPLSSADVDALLEAHRGVCMSPEQISAAAARLLATGTRASEQPNAPVPEHPEEIRALFASGVVWVTFVPTGGSASEIGHSVGGDVFVYDRTQVRSISLCDHEYGRDRCNIGRTTPRRFATSALLSTGLWTALKEPVPGRPRELRDARRLADRDWARAVVTLSRVDPSVDYAGFWYL